MANRRGSAKTATEGLKLLWEDNFFRAWRKKDTVVDELAKRENHFSDAELGMALMRAGHLTRRGRRGSYEYIQKYPFVAEASEAHNSKKGGNS
jgi:hypothetical protein